jgi:voltage-gated potassium channel
MVQRHPWRNWLYVVIFESHTAAGKMFDVALLIVILSSVIAVALESVAAIRQAYGTELRLLEWVFTGVFTVEYALRLASARHPFRYAFSFFGIVDLLAVVPSYLSLMIPGAQSLLAVRVLRLIRVFRILKLGEYFSQAQVLGHALRTGRPKIIVFLTGVATVVVTAGAAMHLIEGEEAGFTSIPKSMYWAIVTLTTVGYGDIAPVTPLGQTVAACLMILGYGVIAVPTGIVTVELVRAERFGPNARQCPSCSRSGHDSDAAHCKHCGAALTRQP